MQNYPGQLSARVRRALKTAAAGLALTLVTAGSASALSISGDDRIPPLSFSMSAGFNGYTCSYVATAEGSAQEWAKSDRWTVSGDFAVEATFDGQSALYNLSVTMPSTVTAGTYDAYVLFSATGNAPSVISVTVDEQDIASLAAEAATNCGDGGPPGGPVDPPPFPNQAPTLYGPDKGIISIPENTSVVTDYQAADDSDGEGQGGGLVFTLSGPDMGLFSIDEEGVLAFTSAPDYESPADSGGDNVYNVIVTVTDSGSLFDTKPLAITVTDVEETTPNKAPSLTVSTEREVQENTRAVVMASAVDDLDEVGDGLTFSIGDRGDGAFFTVDAFGAVSFRSSPDYETPADGNHDNVYDLVLVVTDSGNLTDSAAITVTVTDVDETPANKAPKLTVDTAVNVPENSTAVVTASAVDDTDTMGSGLTFSISGTDGSLFTVDAAGAVSFRVAPDFETPTDAGGDNVYDLVLFVTDSGELADSKSVAVTVTDVDEGGSPSVGPTLPGGSAFTVKEGTTSIADFDADDDKDDEYSGLTYSIEGIDSHLFDIDRYEGKVTFKTAPSYATPADSNTDNVYQLTVKVTDSDNNVGSLAITVTVIANGTVVPTTIATITKVLDGITRTQFTVETNTLARALLTHIKFNPSYKYVTVTPDTIAFAASLSDVTPALSQAANLADTRAEPQLFDAWIEGTFSILGTGKSSGTLGAVTAGAQFMPNADLILGGATQFSMMGTTTGATSVESTGWLAGPYAALRLGGTVIVDAMVMGGQSYSTISPDGTYSDNFTTDRWVAQGGITGDIKMGALTFAPRLGVSYMSTTQHEYTDTMLGLIPGQTSASGELQFGPAITYLIEGEGVDFSPNLALYGDWDFLDSKDVTGRVEGGIDLTFDAGASLSARAFYNGLWASTYSYGGRLSLSAPF